ncbi:MAG: hypothetical protein JNL72_13755 [Flavipsychrobacter sp.]|nr:hypothetical protein [Flavipsychrobacter sp.]
MITSIEFNKTSTANFVTPATHNVYMANTGNTSLATTLTWAAILTTHTQVYSTTSLTLPATTGWVPWTITPFLYTGGALEIAFELQMAGNGGATANIPWEYTAGTATMVVGAFATGSYPATLNGAVAAYKHRPNIRITFTTGPCTDPPTAGDATATPNSNVCPGSNVALNLVNNSSGSGQTYQWQSSPNNTTYTNFGSSQLGPALTVNPTSSIWYRCAVTCGATTTFSTPVQVSVLPGLSGNYTINSAVITGGTNFQSFNDFASALACGISGPVVATVVSGSGPYNEQVTFPQVSGASATNTITINGNGETINYSSANTNERAGIKLDGADYFDINNLVINATGTYGYCIQLLSGSSHNTIDSCTLNTSTTSTSTTNYAGIVASGSATSMTTAGNDCDSNTFSNNTIVGGYYSIKLMGNGTIDRFIANKVLNNTVQDFYSYGIHLDGHDYALVQGNNVSRPTRTSITTMYGIYFTDVINGRITRNRIHNPMGGALTSTSAVYCIYFTTNDATSATANIVANNAIYNINNQGIIYALYNIGSDYAYYYHNTISLDNTSSTATTATRAFFQSTAATGLEFVNNIVTISRGGTGAKHAIYLGTVGTSLTSNRNILYINATAGSNNVGYQNGADFTTLADWQGQGYDIGSQAVDPIYTNVGIGDFTPQEASINNLGLPVGISSDINGNPRNVTTPDPGAFEFGLPPCIDPPTAGDATATPGSVCAGQLVALSLTGNSAGDGQTYQWQLSTDGVNYTNFGTSSTSTNTNNTPMVNTWYRAAVTCGTSTVISTPVLVSVTSGITGVYTINSAVVTGGSNFQSFNDFAAALACGVSGPVVANVVAGSGPYNEQVTFGDILGVSATNTITINGNGETLTYASTNTNERAGIKFNGADYFTINNLAITATGTYGYCIHLLSGSSNNTINNCLLTTSTTSTSTTNYAGIVASGSPTSMTTVGLDCDSNTFSNNTIIGGYYSIKLMGNGTVNRFIDNKVLNNTVQDFYSYGIHLDGHDNALVEGNDISRPTRTSITTHYGIYFTDIINGRINANRIHNPMGAALTSTSAVYGIYFTTCDATSANANIVSNNAIYDINNNGIIYAIYNIGSDHAYHYHNTISLDHTPATTTSATRAFYQTTAATGLQFVDNVITIGRGGAGAKHAIYLGTNTTALASANNDIYISATAGSNYTGFFNAINYTTLADWQAIGYDANSADLDPVYQNMGLGDLTPTNLAMDNLGTPVGISSDILSANRSATNPDMGAWEFLTVPCADPTGLMASNITGTTADLSWDAINFIPGYEYSVDQSPTPPTGNGTFTTSNTYNATGLTQSTQYYLHVRIFCGNGNYSQWVTLPFETSCPNAVAVVSYTGPTTFCQGDSLVLSAQTDPNYTYQWRLNGTDIPGAIDSTYAVVASGSYQVKVSNGVGCTTTSLPAVPVTVNPAPPAVISGNLSICYSGSVTLSANTGTGLTYQWQENGVDIPGATNTTYATTDSGSFTVRVTITATGCSATSAPADVVINAPAVVSVNDSFNCGPGTVTLTGVPSPGATLYWYDVPGGTLLDTGNSFTTPFIGTTTTYYVTAGMGASVGNVGPVTPQSVGAGSGFSTNIYWLLFDVLQPTTIVSVDVFPTGTIGSNASINIEDNLGNVIHTAPYVTTVTGGATAQTVPINFAIAPGLQYRMRQGTATALYRNTAGATFPYTSSAINITGHNFTTATFYYFFYNWQFTTGCESGTTAVVANINPVPVATATTNDPTAICPGDLVNMNGTAGTGYTYQWLNNGNVISGADSVYHVVNVAGNYSVIVTEGPCADTSNVIAVTDNLPPAANIYPQGSTTICQGNNLVLNANTGTGLTYQWHLNGVDIPGATNSSLTVNTAGDYTVTVATGTSASCDLTSPIVTVTVVPPPPITVTPGGPTSVCAGETVELDAQTGTSLTYQWQESGINIPGANAAEYEAAVSGTYTVIVSNGACALTSAPIVVTVFPAINPVANLVGNTLVTGAYTAYQWYQNGFLIPGATNQSFNPVTFADYFVIVTDANGCKDTSNIVGYYAVSVGTTPQAGDEVSIYPNPAVSRVFIKAPQKVNVILTTVDGKVVLEKQDATFIDLGDIAAGVYQVKVLDKDNNVLKIEKILKSGQ